MTAPSLKKILAILLLLSLACGAGFLWRLYQPMGVTQATSVVINRGHSTKEIAQDLYALHAVDSWLFFYVCARVVSPLKPLKTGEYALTPTLSYKDFITALKTGKTVQRRLTIPEGATSAFITETLRQATGIMGDFTPPAEGSCAPNTYAYSYGDTPQSVLTRMEKAHEKLLDSLWLTRPEAYPLSFEEWQVLASIVERETRLDTERAHVAAVFLNRLQRGMPLQADPTVLYAHYLASGRTPKGALSKEDLQIASPYNTYKNRGLPPGPICHAGAASLQAALHPDTTKDLYFVADGQGGHVFAATLKEHQQNHQAWRTIRDSVEKAKPPL